MNPSGNTILITGGSGGIGRELAHRFHDADNRVIVTGRRQDALDQTVAGRKGMTAYTLDMTDAGAIADFAGRVTRDHPELNILVNNVGIMRRDDLTRTGGLDAAEETVVTNLLGPIRLTDALVDHLTSQPGAAIVTVSSGLAYVPLTISPVYSATKAAIHSYSVSLREQLRGQVEVIELVPPGVQTELTPGQSDRPGYMPLDEFIDEVMALFGQQPTPPEIMVERVRPARFAEREGTFDERLAMMVKASQAR